MYMMHMTSHQRPQRRGTRTSARGFSLIDALIALALLAFGMLAMTRLQARSLAQATESQARMVAAQLGDELLSSVLVDPGNRACYTLPADGTCGSATAKAIADDWETRALAALKDGAATSSYDATTNRMEVVLTWKDRKNDDPRQLTATTDVR
jgi:type IV pilus assembly protein PilV